MWLGREWQDYCLLLLSRRYALRNAHALQRVPDRDRGDLGLEAFSHDGCAFQCYAAEEPLSTSQRYEKQRDKLTRDLAKLRDRQAEVSLMLGNIILHRYIFMVHKFDSKELIKHAHAQAAKVVSWELPFIAAHFSIVIETDDDYAAERAEIHAIPQPLVEPAVVDHCEQGAWQQANLSLLDTARAKLGSVISSASVVDNVLDTLSRKYLEGENSLERLRSIQPEVHSRLRMAKSRKEDLLVLEYTGQAAQDHGLLAQIASEFAASLKDQNPTLTLEATETFAWAAVADWLMRCPLDFEVSP